MKKRTKLFALVLIIVFVVSFIAVVEAEKKPFSKVKKPVVKIISPRGGQSDDRVVTVSGTVSDTKITKVTIVLNGTPLDLPCRNGRFNRPLIMAPGNNTVQVIAENDAGTGRDAVNFFSRVPIYEKK